MTTAQKPNAETILPERAPALWVPLRFFAAGIFFLVTLLAVAGWKAPMLAQEYLHNPATLTLTHLFTLGFGGSVVTGAIYQIAPVLLHSRLFSERMADVHLAIHTLGTALMIIGFLSFKPVWTATGGTLVVLGAILFVVNLVGTLRAAERWNWHGSFIGAAVFYYISTLLWGLVLAFNQKYGFLGEVEGASLNAHLAMGLGGWFSLMIVGVGLKLVPMFAPANALPRPFVAAVGGSLALGVLTYVAALLVHLDLLASAGLLMMTGSAFGYAFGVARVYLRRRSGPLDFSVRFALTSAGALVLALLAALAGWAGLWDARPPRAGVAVFFALAWIGGTILGMLLRIVPFMVWLNRFRHRTHKLEKIPFLHEMFHPLLGWAAYGGWYLGALLLAAGMATGVPALLVSGALAGTVAVSAHVAAMVQTLTQATPGTSARYPAHR